MTHFPPDDKPLIQFLKQYRPVAPKTATSVEKQLMQWVAQKPHLSSKKHISLFWVIPSAIAASILATWLGGQQTQTSFEITAQSKELESFVIDSWNSSLKELSDTNYETNLESWLILEETESNSNNITYYK
ncbi:hypothetical protein C7H19_17075 [Aphanothece hegewaldii CCALA 016]|uniref:Uncharacterized protein n=1 Tax=Aphanothece hegewaldii CCALA 016 TaxID=2107694 RepID=A0A2T1LUM6_9CHRO|nr:hypothetical protein [Aphanothece hegewaldii]PSF35270.1 hypothetical protein C7H19_17075 [Aphanothece hegewaldii CCALA 016]